MRVNDELSNDDLIVVDELCPEDRALGAFGGFIGSQQKTILMGEVDQERVSNVSRYLPNIDLEISDGAFIECHAFPIPEEATKEQLQCWYHPVQIFGGDQWDTIIKNSVGMEVVRSHVMVANIFFQAHTDKKVYHYPNLHSLDHTDDNTWTMLWWAGDGLDLESEFILFDNRRENIDPKKPLMYNSIPMIENRAVFFKSNRMWTKSRSNFTYAELEYAFTVSGK